MPAKRLILDIFALVSRRQYGARFSCRGRAASSAGTRLRRARPTPCPRELQGGKSVVSYLSLRGEALGRRKPRKPKLTGTRKENAVQSTLNHTLKTQTGTLPQSQALEDSLADMPGQARNGASPKAGGQVVRGEPGFGQRYRGSLGDPASGASHIVFLHGVFLHGSGRCQSPVPPVTQQQERRACLPSLNAGASSAKTR